MLRRPRLDVMQPCLPPGPQILGAGTGDGAAAGPSVDRGRWLGTFDELMTRAGAGSAGWSRAARQIPLTRNEIAHLLAAVTAPPGRDAGHRLLWSHWRRRHQHRARTCHYQRQITQDPATERSTVGVLDGNVRFCVFSELRDNVAVQEAAWPWRQTAVMSGKSGAAAPWRCRRDPSATESGYSGPNRPPSFSSLLLATPASADLAACAHRP
jgi:hypothetical protein